MCQKASLTLRQGRIVLHFSRTDNLLALSYLLRQGRTTLSFLHSGAPIITPVNFPPLGKVTYSITSSITEHLLPYPALGKVAYSVTSYYKEYPKAWSHLPRQALISYTSHKNEHLLPLSYLPLGKLSCSTTSSMTEHLYSTTPSKTPSKFSCISS